MLIDLRVLKLTSATVGLIPDSQDNAVNMSNVFQKSTIQRKNLDINKLLSKRKVAKIDANAGSNN